MLLDVATPFDDLSKADLESRVLEFARSEVEQRWDKAALDQYMNTIVPRSVFLRNLPFGASVLDLGAGEGGLSVLKQWPLVTRPDLELYAVSLDVGERFGDYEAYELGNFEETLPDFGGMQFDAIVCSHFIEHLADPSRAMQFFATRLKPGGMAYVEWPHPVSKTMPSLTVLHAIDFNVMTTNFFDDRTHREAWPMEFVASAARLHRMQIVGAGRLWYDFLADQLLAHGKPTNHSVSLTYATWFKFAWSQYLVVSRPLA